MREQVTALRNWARTHARSASSLPAGRRIVDEPASHRPAQDAQLENR
jgi:hypothetical protein